MRDGSRVETKGPYEVKGRRVLFSDPQGRLSSLRLDEVDLEASRRLAEAPPPVAAPVAEAKKPVPVLTLTNKDLASVSFSRVTLPGERGELTFELPSGWDYELRQPPGQLPPTLVLSGGDFRFLVSVLWSPQGDPSFNEPRKLRTLTEDIALQVRDGSTREPVVEPLPGSQGFWFWAADRAPRPGEYEYMAKGILAVGKLLLTFTALTHQQPPNALISFSSFLSRVSHIES